MAFNSADTAAFKNVWVFCEQRQGVMMPTTFELISEGRKLANELGVELCGRCCCCGKTTIRPASSRMRM